MTRFMIIYSNESSFGGNFQKFALKFFLGNYSKGQRLDESLSFHLLLFIFIYNQIFGYKYP